MPTDVLLQLQALRAGYGGTPILQGVDLVLHRREITAIIGRNGVGKTTLMKVVIGLLEAVSGRVIYENIDVTRLRANERARRGIGYIPQGRGLFPRMTVAENLTVGELIGGRRGKKYYDLVFELFPILAEKMNCRASSMSGGQQQMLSIGRALVGGPKLVLLDEPSEGIQPSIVRQISDTMTEICRRFDMSILLVEQNINMIRAMARRCYVMDKGRIIGEVATEQLADPSVARRYLAV